MSAHANENAVFAYDNVPFLATSFEAAEKLAEIARPTIEKVLEEQNLTLLYSVPWPPQGLYFKKEVNAVADMEGVKSGPITRPPHGWAELTGMLPVTSRRLRSVRPLPPAWRNP